MENFIFVQCHMISEVNICIQGQLCKISEFFTLLQLHYLKLLLDMPKHVYYTQTMTEKRPKFRIVCEENYLMLTFS